MSKIGRNDPCPCGSGNEYKKCHLGRLADPKSQEFQAKAWALFDGKIAAERQRKQRFGEERPIIHADAWGKKLVAVGSRIYFNDDPAISFSDFLQHYPNNTDRGTPLCGPSSQCHSDGARASRWPLLIVATAAVNAAISLGGNGSFTLPTMAILLAATVVLLAWQAYRVP